MVSINSWYGCFAENPVQNLPHLPSFVEVRNQNNVVVQHHLSQWQKLPLHTIEILRVSGVRILVGEGSVTNFPGYERYRTMPPRGWPEGTTLEMVSGMYDRGGKVVIVGGWADNLGVDLLHEIGHAVGHATGMDDSQAIVLHHVRLFGNLESYLQQGGPGGYAGRHELFAVGVAEVLVNEEIARLLFDDELVDWLLGILYG